MLQIGIGEKDDNLSASVEVQLLEIDKIGCRQNGRAAVSRAKQSEIFPFPSVTCGAQRSTRDRVGEPYAMPNWVILAYVIMSSLSRFIHHALHFTLLTLKTHLNVSIGIYLRQNILQNISGPPNETSTRFQMRLPKKSPERPQILTKTMLALLKDCIKQLAPNDTSMNDDKKETVYYGKNGMIKMA